MKSTNLIKRPNILRTQIKFLTIKLTIKLFMSSNNIIPFPFHMGFLRATGPFHKIDAEEVTKFLDQK